MWKERRGKGVGVRGFKVGVLWEEMKGVEPGGGRRGG